MDLLGVLDRLAKGEKVEIKAGGYSAPSPVQTGENLTEDGRWGRATSEEVQSRLGVTADGRMGPSSWSALQEVFGTRVDGTVSKQSHKHDALGNGISPNGWDYTGPGSTGSTVIEALQRAVGAEVDGILYEGTTKLLQKKLNSDPKFLTTVVDTSSDVDGRFGTNTVKAFQKFLNKNGAKLKVDGKAGHEFWKALQRYLKTPVDGEVSNQSYKPEELGNGITQGWDFDGRGAKGSTMVKALQKWVGVKADGVWGENTTEAVQRKLVKLGYSL